MSPSKLRKLKVRLAKIGATYTGPRCEPTKVELFRLQPQHCRECGNAHAGRVALSPDQGRFFTNHNGPRWVCDRCIKLYKMSNDPSPGEKRLANLLIDHHINFLPQHVLHGRAFDFYIPEWNLLVEVDSWSAHHTAVQKKKDYWRDKVARLHGIHLLRVNWKDRACLEKVHAARVQGALLLKGSS